ncbi:MAG: hypothetical protein MI919_34370 [Holophagales bacterium]|nr:hypothetical protein [Holophagales bacterium]
MFTARLIKMMQNTSASALFSPDQSVTLDPSGTGTVTVTVTDGLGNLLWQTEATELDAHVCYGLVPGGGPRFVICQRRPRIVGFTYVDTGGSYELADDDPGAWEAEEEGEVVRGRKDP